MKTIINNIKDLKDHNLYFTSITIDQDKQAILNFNFKVDKLNDLNLSYETYLNKHFVFFNFADLHNVYQKGLNLKNDQELIKLNNRSFTKSNLRPLRLIAKWLKEENLKIPFEEDELNTIRKFWNFTITIKFNDIVFCNEYKHTYFNWSWSNKKIDQQTQARKKQELIKFIKELKYKEGN